MLVSPTIVLQDSRRRRKSYMDTLEAHNMALQAEIARLHAENRNLASQLQRMQPSSGRPADASRACVLMMVVLVLSAGAQKTRMVPVQLGGSAALTGLPSTLAMLRQGSAEALALTPQEQQHIKDLLPTLPSFSTASADDMSVEAYLVNERPPLGLHPTSTALFGPARALVKPS